MSIDVKVDDRTELAWDTWRKWLQMWNEDSSVALDIVADRYRLHLPDASSTIDPATIVGPVEMKNWVDSFVARFDRLTYSTDWGPMLGPETFAFRWVGSATWKGATGWPLDIPGQPVLFVGIDVFRMDAGKIVECWSQGAITKTI